MLCLKYSCQAERQFIEGRSEDEEEFKTVSESVSRRSDDTEPYVYAGQRRSDWFC